MISICHNVLWEALDIDQGSSWGFGNGLLVAGVGNGLLVAGFGNGLLVFLYTKGNIAVVQQTPTVRLWRKTALLRCVLRQQLACCVLRQRFAGVALDERKHSSCTEKTNGSRPQFANRCCFLHSCVLCFVACFLVASFPWGYFMGSRKRKKRGGKKRGIKKRRGKKTSVKHIMSMRVVHGVWTGRVVCPLPEIVFFFNMYHSQTSSVLQVMGGLRLVGS